MKRAFLLSAVVAAALLSGCNATMGDLQRSADNLAKSAQAAVTPVEYMTYQAHSNAARPILDNSAAAMKSAGLTPKLHTVKVTFRDSIGRVFETPLTVEYFRFGVPQDVIEADDKSIALTPLMTAMGARFVQWNAVEPLELVAVASTAENAELLASELRTFTPGIKVTKLVGPSATVGYGGVEMRMINKSLARSIK